MTGGQEAAPLGVRDVARSVESGNRDLTFRLLITLFRKSGQDNSYVFALL